MPERKILEKNKKTLALFEKVWYNQKAIYGIVLCMPLSDWEHRMKILRTKGCIK